MQLLYCRAPLFVFVSLITAIIPNLSQTFLNADCTQGSTSPRHFIYTRTRVPHARHACLVLDFSEPNCDWSKRMTSWKSFVGSFSQTLFFGGVTQKPEIRLFSQAKYTNTIQPDLFLYLQHFLLVGQAVLACGPLVFLGRFFRVRLMLPATILYDQTVGFPIKCIKY